MAASQLERSPGVQCPQHELEATLVTLCLGDGRNKRKDKGTPEGGSRQATRKTGGTPSWGPQCIARPPEVPHRSEGTVWLQGPQLRTLCFLECELPAVHVFRGISGWGGLPQMIPPGSRSVTEVGQTSSAGCAAVAPGDTAEQHAAGCGPGARKQGGAVRIVFLSPLSLTPVAQTTHLLRSQNLCRLGEQPWSSGEVGTRT